MYSEMCVIRPPLLPGKSGLIRDSQIHVKYSPVLNQSGFWSQGGLSREVVFNTGFNVHALLYNILPFLYKADIFCSKLGLNFNLCIIFYVFQP